jgi:ABC-type oligopeptide transport system ATPase subunit
LVINLRDLIKMDNVEFVGQIVGGNFGQLLIRKKSDARVEIGELLISENDSEKFMLMTYDIKYASQISQQNIDMISGFGLEESEPVEIFDSHIRNYTIVVAKVILKLTSKNATMPKDMPLFFSKVRKVNSADFSFLSKPKDSLLEISGQEQKSLTFQYTFRERRCYHTTSF